MALGFKVSHSSWSNPSAVACRARKVKDRGSDGSYCWPSLQRPEFASCMWPKVKSDMLLSYVTYLIDFIMWADCKKNLKMKLSLCLSVASTSLRMICWSCLMVLDGGLLCRARSSATVQRMWLYGRSSLSASLCFANRVHHCHKLTTGFQHNTEVLLSPFSLPYVNDVCYAMLRLRDVLKSFMFWDSCCVT